MLAPKIDREPAPKIKNHLAHSICVGPIDSKKERPRKASCCYPAREAISRPLRAAFPALRACYDARKNRGAEGRVVFVFRVEQDGSIPQACSGDSTSVEDADAVHCMIQVIRTVRYPATSDEERDFCGLLHFTYPVIFEP